MRATNAGHMNLLDMMKVVSFMKNANKGEFLQPPVRPTSPYFFYLLYKYSPQQTFPTLLNSSLTVDMKGQVSLPYKATGKILVLFNYIF
jgi:hypothetical protein